jgi:sugar lactone lactonase YvrE
MSRTCGIALAALLIWAPTHASSAIPLLRPAEPAPNSIVAAPDGTLYFVDPLSRSVWRVQPDGQVTPFVAGTSGASLGVDSSGNIYGTHSEARGRIVVWRADPDGTVSEVARVRTHAAARQLLLASGAAGMSSPAFAAAGMDGMTRIATGELIITTGPAIRKVGLDGRVTTIASGGRLLEQRTGFLGRLLGETPAHLTGVAVSDDGVIYVANAARRSVVRVLRDGRVEEVYGAGSGWRPMGVAAAGGGIYVLEYGAGVRVRRLLDDGGSRLVAAVPHRAAVAGTAMPWLPI